MIYIMHRLMKINYRSENKSLNNRGVLVALSHILGKS